MKIRDKDGSLRDGWDLLVELEARYLPLAATAETVVMNEQGTYDGHEARFALACGAMHFLTDLRDVRDAISELENQYKRALAGRETKPAKKEG